VNTEITDINVENGRCGRLFYDADCAWCAPLAEQVRGLLGRRRIELEPLQSAGVSAALGIPAEDVLQEMKFLTEAGEVFGGAEAAAQIARRFWWSWPLFALSRLPGVMPAFGHLYRWIADRRGCSGGATGPSVKLASCGCAAGGGFRIQAETSRLGIHVGDGTRHLLRMQMAHLAGGREKPRARRRWSFLGVSVCLAGDGRERVFGGPKHR